METIIVNKEKSNFVKAVGKSTRLKFPRRIEKLRKNTSSSLQKPGSERQISGFDDDMKKTCEKASKAQIKDNHNQLKSEIIFPNQKGK